MITISRNDETYGPYTPEQIQTMLAAGEVHLNDHAWREGEADWKPLVSLLSVAATPPPLPPPQPLAAAPQATAETVYLKEGVVMVTQTRVVIGAQIFPVRNIASVAHGMDKPRRFWPLLGFIFFGLFTIGALGQISVQGPNAGTVFWLIFSAGVFIFSMVKLFKPARHVVVISTSGAEQRPFAGTAAQVDRIVNAINAAIISLG